MFNLEIVDLGKIFKCKVRHDNSFLNPSWYLDKVEVVDNLDKETYTFHCERWLAKNKDDNKIEKSLYVKVGLNNDIIRYLIMHEYCISKFMVFGDYFLYCKLFNKLEKRRSWQLQSIKLNKLKKLKEIPINF